MRFYLRIGGDGCDPPDQLDQGLRLEIRVSGSSSLWDPVMFYSNTTSAGQHSFVQMVNHTHVHVMEEKYNSTIPLTLLPASESIPIREHICGLDPQSDSFRLRWVQYPYGQHDAGQKTVAIDNIMVDYWDGVCLRRVAEWMFEEESDQ